MRPWGAVGLLGLLAPALQALPTDHYLITKTWNRVMKGDSDIVFSVTPLDVNNALADDLPHDVIFILNVGGVTVVGAPGTGDATGWEVNGVAGFTMAVSQLAPLGPFTLRVQKKSDATVRGEVLGAIDPTVASFLVEPTVPGFSGYTGEDFGLSIRALGSFGQTIESFTGDVRLTADVGALGVVIGGADNIVTGSSFVNGVSLITLKAFGTNTLSRQNVIRAVQVEDYGLPSVASGQTVPLTINPNSFHHVILRFPGENLTPGVGTGKAGAPSNQPAGGLINPVVVHLVDQWHNPINAADAVKNPPAVFPVTVNYTSYFNVFGGIPPDDVPADSLINGGNFANVSFTMYVADQHLIEACAGGQCSQSNVNVVSGNANMFRLSPDLSLLTQHADAPKLITVEAVDQFGNVLEWYNLAATMTVTNCDDPGASLGVGALDTDLVTGGVQTVIQFVAGKWENRPVMVFKASNQTRLSAEDLGTGLLGKSTCFDNDPGGAAFLFFTLPGQTFTEGLYPGNANAPNSQTAGVNMNLNIRVTDASWNIVPPGLGQPLTLFSTTGEVDVPAGLVMPAGGQLAVANAKFLTSSYFQPQVWRATAGGLAGQSDPLTVHAGAYARLVLAGPGEQLAPGDLSEPDGKTGSNLAPLTYNVPFPIRIYATDNYWNPIEAGPYGGLYPSVQMALLEGGDIVFPANPINMGSAVYTGLVTSRVLGSNNITATDTRNAARFDQIGLTIDPGAVARLVVTPDPGNDLAALGIVPVAGDPVAWYVKAYDAAGNPARNFNGVVDLRLLDDDGSEVPFPGAMTPATVTFTPDPATGGVSSATVRVYYAGKQVQNGADKLKIRAVYGAIRGDSQPFSVRELAAWSDIVLTIPDETRRKGIQDSVYKSGAPRTYTSETSMTVQLTAVDLYGNRVVTGGNVDVSVLTPGVRNSIEGGLTLSLDQGEASANIQIYTATQAVVSAVVPARGFSDTSTVTVNPGLYTGTGRLVLLAPGELLLPGSLAPPGKDATGILSPAAYATMTVTAVACDFYFNQTQFNGGNITLASSDGAFNRTGLTFSNGRSDIADVFLTGNRLAPYPQAVVLTASEGSKTSVSNMTVLQGIEYFLTVPAQAVVGSTFSMTIALGAPPLAGANHAVAIEALTPAGIPIPDTGLLGVKNVALTNGVAVFEQFYARVENIRLRVTDAYGRTSTSDEIAIRPTGLEYRLTAPAQAKADESFSVTVALYDPLYGPITDSRYNHNFTLAVLTSLGLPAAGQTPLSGATLVNGQAVFDFSYTKREGIILQATGSVAGFDVSGSFNIDIRPGTYAKLLVVAPGEVAVPGVPSPTGKDSTGLLSQAAGRRFTTAVYAVDQYWNIVDSVLGGTVRLSASDTSLDSLPGLPFVNGEASFSDVILRTPPNVVITARDEVNAGIFTQSVVVPVTGRAYVPSDIQSSSPPDFFTGTAGGNSFNLLVELREYTGSVVGDVVVGFGGEVTVSPLGLDLQPLPPENLIIANPVPVNGLWTIQMPNDGSIRVFMHYRVAQDVILKFIDAEGWTGYSAPIHFVPQGIRYEAVFPAEAVVGQVFPMTVSAVDTGTDLPANNWTATVNLSPAEVGTGVPGTEVLSVPSVNLSNGPVTVSQAYTQAGTFNFVLNDGSLPPSTSASPILMRPGPLAKLETDLPATLEAGQSQIINITLLDAYDNPIPNAPAEFSLSDSSFGTLSTLSGVTNAQGQTATTFVTNGQKSGSGIFTARSQGFDVDQGFRLLGPPSTTIRAGGRAVEEAKGISIKPGDPLYLDVQVETGVTLTEVRYSFDGGASWTTEPGPFTITEGRAVVDVLPLLTVVGQYAVQFYGVTQSVLAHTETIKTSKPIFVSAETGAGEGLVNYPNPFRAGRDLTFLEYTLDAAAGVRLTIYDLLGQRVYERSYSQGESGGEAGANRISWDGRNGDGMTVANGGYVAVLETATGTKMKRKIAVRK